jgi:hypothetical protein
LTWIQDTGRNPGLRKRSIVILSISTVFLIAILGFVVWAETPLGPMPEAIQALKSDSMVDVSEGQWVTFAPHGLKATTGFIIYPGGRVNYKSYAPTAHAIAARGYLTIIMPMPLNLAVLGVNRANAPIKSYTDIKAWAIGGHSLGGAMAAQFAHDNPALIKGLALWAAYPASGTDLSKINMKVVTIHGTNDGLVSAAQIDDSLKQLPPDTVRVEIQGGNHGQFGWYGDQPGDNPARISREAQQEQTVNATCQLLEKIKPQ